MALVLSLREGDDFYLGDAQVVVSRVGGAMDFDLTLLASGRTFTVSDAESCEIMPDVFISAGDQAKSKALARLAIDAPRSITIMRGDRWRTYQDVLKWQARS